jgi:hypothetical protein
MRKVIHGTVYDTKKAVRLHGWSRGTPGDHHYVKHALYRAENGEFFLAGESGALGSYGQRCGQSDFTEGWGIRELSAREARQWLKDFGAPGSLIEEYFPPNVPIVRETWEEPLFG